MKAWLQRRWYSQQSAPLLLTPLSRLYGAITDARRHRLESARVPLALPVIVVGNISLGGTGKTPFVIWLVEHLRDWGWRPGVISRGYGGRAPQYPFRVEAGSDPALVGDEPLLIALRTGVPVVVDPDRVAAARLLIASGEVDVLIADDGLQHYRLPRQLEFCVVDGARGVGNGALLPAGPLREPPSRLSNVDLVVVNGAGFDGGPESVRFDLRTGRLRSLVSGEPRTLADFAGSAVHAIAGIGNPLRFFASLESAGLRVHRHAFDDHHRYRPQDLAFGDGLPVLMTEKDAVKCHAFAQGHWWALPVSAELSPADEKRVRESCSVLNAANDQINVI
ncbi:tetraacyldisaccharide 4'-kinase [Hydrocarboniphaga sp.]|uniref:tetraacyldisaccharide 4'-kinase n=1 Tax=Hydrocarboniphaga sp. TaxID=2033016 RepID=UPI0026205074|nr:tetraacyldisaccharide 4'-kinase [Hydrocarboniphaga sp.]